MTGLHPGVADLGICGLLVPFLGEPLLDSKHEHSARKKKFNTSTTAGHELHLPVL